MKTKLKKSGPAAAQFERVESGIFRYIPSGVYYERPKINGRRTWRSLETANLKYAREELHRRRSGMVEREAHPFENLGLLLPCGFKRYEI